MGGQSGKVLRDLDFNAPVDAKVARALWKKYDTNRDGVLDEGEFRCLVTDWAKQHNVADVEASFQKIWGSYEKDQSGQLPRDVFLGHRVRSKSKLGGAPPPPAAASATTTAGETKTAPAATTAAPSSASPSTTTAAAPAASAADTATGSAANPTIPNPVRMLLSATFGGFESTGVPCFENLPANTYMDFEFETYEKEIFQDTAVISWRWMKQKPPNVDVAKEKDKCPVPPALVPYMAALAKREGIKYLWLDWSCAPQYPSDVTATMREINRSGKYYASARAFYVWCYDGPVNGIDFTHSDYFFRAWTLSERLHRARNKGPLTALHFLPYEVRNLVSEQAVLAMPKPANQVWGATLAKICATMRISITVTGGSIAAEDLTTILDLVSTRLAPFQKTVTALKGSFKTVLEPHVHACLLLCLQLACFSHWIAHPFVDDDMCLMFQMPPLQFKQTLLQQAINRARQILNNFRRSNLNEILERINIQAATQANVSSILEPVTQLWGLALESGTAEQPASSAFLRRYLSFEADCTYKAFSKPDLLFAIYKLFDIGDFAYGQELALYQKLVEKAGLPFISSGDPYAWLKELVLLNDDEGEMVGSLLHARQNNRSNTDLATSSNNFSIFSFDTKFLTTERKALPVPQILCSPAFLDPTPEVITLLFGFRLDTQAQQALKAKGRKFTVVDKAMGGEMDRHLSLRGRQALAAFENKLHGALEELFAVGAWAEPCALFVLARYGTFSCLSKCVLLRTCLTGEHWGLEGVAGFGSEAMKGSSYGVAKSLDSLVADLSSLPGSVQVSSMSHGSLSGSSDVKPKSFPPQPWFLGTALAIQPFAAPTVVTAPIEEKKAPPPETKKAEPPQEETTGSLVVPAKTNFQEADLQLVERIFAHGKKRDFEGPTLQLYFNVVSSNYVHDSVMAQHLGYFTKLCQILARHLTEEKDLLNVAALRQKFEYMAEDLGDAIDMSDADAATMQSARTALAQLNTAMED